MWRLPARIRPAAFAFGTLADGFVPFDCEAAAADGGGGSGGIDGDAQATHGGAACSDGGSGAAGGGAPPGSGSAAGGGTAGCGSAVQAEVKLCSVVMKAVQASRPGAALPRSTESGGCCGGWVLHRVGAAQVCLAAQECGGCCVGPWGRAASCLPSSGAGAVRHLLWVNPPFLSSDSHL